MRASQYKLIIADPSFNDHVGHYAKYDLAIIDACLRNEIDCEVWGSISCAVGSNKDFIKKVYIADAWGNPYINTSPITRIFNLLKNFLNRNFHRSGFLGLIYLHTKFSKILNRLKIFAKSYPKTRSVLLIYLPFFLGLNIFRNLKLCLRDIFLNIYLNIYAFFSSEYKLTIGRLKREKDTANLVLFCHMITESNFLDWILVALYCEKKGINLGLLFRYPTYFFDKDTLKINIAKFAFSRLLDAQYVKYYTDSELLTRSYAEYFSVPFLTCPIPHVPESKAPPKDQEKLVISMLGNARVEKGFVDFAKMITENWELLMQQNITIYLQVNNPDFECNQYIEELESLNLSFLKFIYQPMDENEYEKLVDCTDIMVLPYHSDVYQERTSGVLFEAISKGKVCLVTKSTWLERELSLYGSGFVIQDKSPQDIFLGLQILISEYKKFRDLANKKQKTYNSIHGAERFLDLVLLNEDSRPNLNVNVKNVLIIFPFPDFIEQKTGASTRVGMLSKFLIENGYNVTVLLPTQIRSSTEFSLPISIIEYSAQNSFIYYVSYYLTKFFGAGNVTRGLWYISCFFSNQNNLDYRSKLAVSIMNSDAVLLEYPFFLKNVIKIARVLNRKVVVTFHDVLHAMRLPSLIQSKIKSLDVSYLDQVQAVVTVSKGDQDNLKASGINSSLIVSPCDFDFYLPKKPSMLNGSEKILFFVGANHPPNNSAAIWLRKFSAKLNGEFSDFKIVVAGNCMGSFQANNFLALGRVSDEELEYLYANSLACIFPLWDSTGISLKTIQAMSRGCPVVGTKDAFRGMDVKFSENCLYANSEDEFMQAIRTLESNPAARAAISREAAAYAKNFDYRSVYSKYLPLLN